jgi:hypothetical protein
MMEAATWLKTPDAAINQFLRPGGLCALESNRTNPARASLLARLPYAPEIPVLLTPGSHKPMSRVLILQDHNDPSAGFLESAARLCQGLEIQPLILTLASSEEDALLKQRFTEEVCARLGLPADFDAAVSFNVYAAVDHAARWRNCSHVFFERTTRTKGLPLWRRPLDVFSQWCGVSDSLAFLFLPEGLALDLPKKTHAGRFGRAWSSPSSTATPVSTNGTNVSNSTNASEVTRDPA